MKLFIDTANIDEIKAANELGVICGVTTNPSLIAKEGKDFKSVINEIVSIVDGPISAEVIALDSENMIKEGIELAYETNEEQLAYMAELYGYEDVDAVKAAAEEEELREIALAFLVMDYVVEHCVQVAE